MTSELREEFDRYWSDRVPGLVEYTRYLLNNDTDFNHTLRIFLKDTPVGSRVLDMGTGAGLVALEMARMGFKVDAMDCNEDVLKAAVGLAEEMNLDVYFMLGDVTEPEISGKEYDVIVARNVVWNLEDPAKAYSQWRKLLRPGGYLIVFDGNYYLYYSEPMYKRRKGESNIRFGSSRSLDARTNVNNVQFDRCDKLAKDLPLSKKYRPSWDIAVLTQFGFTDIRALMMDTEDFVYNTAYGDVHTPVTFGLCARMPRSNVVLNLDEIPDELEQVQGIIDRTVDSMVDTWKVLSNKDCVRLLLTLYTVNITASQAAEILGCSYSLASHDLKMLTDAGLVSSERIDGEKVYKLESREAISDLYSLTSIVKCDRFQGPKN